MGDHLVRVSMRKHRRQDQAERIRDPENQADRVEQVAGLFKRGGDLMRFLRATEPGTELRDRRQIEGRLLLNGGSLWAQARRDRFRIGDGRRLLADTGRSMPKIGASRLNGVDRRSDARYQASAHRARQGRHHERLGQPARL